MTGTALAVRHLAFEDLGALAGVLEGAGYEVRYLDAGVAPLHADRFLQADLVVVLGGPISANAGDRYPVVDQEIAALRARLAEGRPTLGICLGAQLMARALGAEVAPGAALEIGYGAVTLTDDGRRSVLRHLRDTPVLHWHGDRFEIPYGARRLASTAACDNQAFAAGPNALALQFHLEVPQRQIERWLIGHAAELAVAGVDPRSLRAAAREHGERAEALTATVVGEWLRRLEP